MDTRIDGKISQANGRLKAGGVRCKIQRMGTTLYLRATLPPKPGSAKTKRFQQRIATGYSANATGLRLAEAEAKTVAALVEKDQFDWEPYMKATAAQPKTVTEWVAAFESDYFQRRERNAKSELTWKKDYRNSFAKLPPEALLDATVVLEAVATTKPDSKVRKRVCMAFGALTRFAGVDVDLTAFKGNYSPSVVEPQELPDDQLIAEWFYRIPNPAWQHVYGLLATYGCRPSEVWQIDLADLPILTIHDGKTGARRVWPYYPEWVDEFQLGKGDLPKVSGATADDLGHRVATQFRRYGIPFPPKILRHAWSVRTIAFGLDTSEAARQQGHSEVVHCNIYHRWLDDRHHQRSFERARQRSDRPMPPEINHSNTAT